MEKYTGWMFVTEGPLKGDLAHALSGRTFGCVPGANQYTNLPPFLQAMKLMGTEAVYEAYDMDSDGDWAENVNGVDDYLYDLEQKKSNS